MNSASAVRSVPLRAVGDCHQGRVSGRATQAVVIDLKAPAFALVDLVQGNPNSELTLADPTGRELYHFDASDVYLIHLPFVASASGTYRLELTPKHPVRSVGDYAVTIMALRAPSPEDEIRVETQMKAWRLLAEGDRLSRNDPGASSAMVADIYRQAISLWEQSGDSDGRVAGLVHLAGHFSFRKEHAAALPVLREALVALPPEHGESARGHLLVSLAGGLVMTGAFPEALATAKQALPLLKKSDDIMLKAAMLTQIGSLTAFTSPTDGLRYLDEALALWRQSGQKEGELAALSVMSGLCRLLGQADKAEECATLIAKIQKELDYASEREKTHMRAVLLLSEGQRDIFLGTAESFKEGARKAGEAAEIWMTLGEEQQAVLAALAAAGALCLAGEAEEALRQCGLVEPKVAATADRLSETLFHLLKGSALEMLGRSAAARSCFERTLALSRMTGDQLAELISLASLAKLDAEELVSPEAAEKMEKALGIIETVRTSMDDTFRRSLFLAKERDYYELNIGLLMKLNEKRTEAGWAAEALRGSERALCRSLCDLLVESKADIRQGIEPSLREKEQILRRLINETENRRSGFSPAAKADSPGGKTAPSLDRLLEEYRDLQAEIRRRSPQYAQLTQPQPLSLREIQENLLDADTLLLEYSLGEQRSYLWVVDTHSLSAFELPPRGKLEEAAQKFYDWAAAPDMARNADEEWKVAIGLSQVLLGPVVPHWKGKRLLIVADGALQYVPFAALPLPGAGQPDSGGAPVSSGAGQKTWIPLVTEHEIVWAPSATAAALLRANSPARTSPTSDGPQISIFADPVFERSDSRLYKKEHGVPPGQPAAATVTVKTRAKTEVGREAAAGPEDTVGKSLGRLAFTKLEAREIAVLVPPGGSHVVMGFEATKAEALGEIAARSRIIHYATHAVIDAKHPELSRIVFSLFDQGGQPIDGNLKALEIYNMKLSSDLAVLSACQAGMGRNLRGEGMANMTRAFMYAGVPRVVTSLWKAADDATRELMARFYRGLLREGKTPAAALRQAQMEMWRQPRWRHPFFWAGFGLHGDWRGMAKQVPGRAPL